MIKDIDTMPVLNKSIGLNYSKTMSSEEKVNYLVQKIRLTINNLKSQFLQKLKNGLNGLFNK